VRAQPVPEGGDLVRRVHGGWFEYPRIPMSTPIKISVNQNGHFCHTDGPLESERATYLGPVNHRKLSTRRASLPLLSAAGAAIVRRRPPAPSNPI
jgi:hypothetical protein